MREARGQQDFSGDQVGTDRIEDWIRNGFFVRYDNGQPSLKNSCRALASFVS
jgi:hypothetical protein